MPVVDVKCFRSGCQNPALYSRLTHSTSHKAGVVPHYQDACADHAAPLMRCKTGRTDESGECLWCNAVNGEVCKLKDK